MLEVEILKKDLHDLKITESQLARFLQVSRPTAHKILKGEKDVTLQQMKVIQRVLGYDEERTKMVFNL